ncbi:MAG: FAD-dependent oxidoreductase [Kangiellaceae bacterium]
MSNTDLDYSAKQQKSNGTQAPIIIIGNGPVGVRAAELILKKLPNTNVILFGEESYPAYNRVQLSVYLAGSVSKAQLSNEVEDHQNHRLIEYVGHKVTQIECKKKKVQTESGQTFDYSKLILALGSTPRIPKISNVELQGVHPFRTIQDADKLLSIKNKCRHIFVVGSGPLGLETAVALKQPNNQITLQVREKLLSHEIGAGAQLVLSDYLKATGITLVTKNPIIKLLGSTKVEAVELKDGTCVPCESLILCSGITPNIELANRAGLVTRRGIVANLDGLTNDPNIYAIGECSEFENITHGIVAPGLAQAHNCVNHIAGDDRRKPVHVDHIQVKFGDYATAHFGRLAGRDVKVFDYTNRLKGIYRKLVVENQKIVGAVLVGNWEEQNKVKQAVESQSKLSDKQLGNFVDTGFLFENIKQPSVKELPEDYLVCLCQSVSRGELSAAIKAGCRTVETLGQKTKAGVTCGSCQPLLANLLDEPAANLVMRHQTAILVTSILSILLIVLTILFEPLEITQTVQMNWHIEKIWFDSFWKKVSGFSLLGLCVIAAGLGLRKRWKRFNFGHVDQWRYIHSLVGVVALIMLMIHTGMRMGENLNLILMMVFLAATTTGSLVGVFMAKNHHWSDVKLAKHRLWWSRIHHTLLWMLPPLLGFHILSAYYF